MTRLTSLFCVLVALCFLSSQSRAQSTLPSAAGQTSAGDAQAMLDNIADLKPPEVDMSRTKDPQYVQSYIQQRDDYLAKRADLAKAFYDKYPDNSQAMPLMLERWMILAQTGKGSAVTSETDSILAKNPDAKTKADILYARAVVPLIAGSDAAAAAVDEFIKAAPTDERGAQLLSAEADRQQDPDKRAALSRRIMAQYPDSSAAEMAKGALRQAEGIGKPFDLSFTDAITGKQISVQKDLKGKVVVVDFWATWCGPCVGEMPANKETYSKFKDKGVEFIGVSLDQPEAQGGLAALKKFVADNDIPWPQYYQGNYWQSAFSSSWGIQSIPTVFVVDADGKLYSTTARGQLETIIPELIAERDKGAVR